ncbi:hypothetical protein PoB_004309300 [Plakobranchus ocellatus]|uniref:Uncharacterized protein n=1 Tax=Plakobranchus ocellatus TaxID=259542 RepID=A0AAV4BCI5_9GAST|nr:hypothetical protein PoB_004309300 [Plakobranchus ocellatus]
MRPLRYCYLRHLSFCWVLRDLATHFVLGGHRGAMKNCLCSYWDPNLGIFTRSTLPYQMSHRSSQRIINSKGQLLQWADKLETRRTVAFLYLTTDNAIQPLITVLHLKKLVAVLHMKQFAIVLHLQQLVTLQSFADAIATNPSAATRGALVDEIKRGER